MRARRVASSAALICAAAAAAASAREEPSYRTPRAGEAFEGELLGFAIDVPGRDRRSTLALTIGAAFFDPPIDGSGASPLFNLYWRRYWDERRILGLFSIAYDFVEYGESLVPLDEDEPGKGSLEGVVLFENYTVPQPLYETRESGRRAEDSAVYFGRVALDVGLGLRRAVDPFAAENDLRVQLLAHAEWQYFDDSHDTPDRAIIPPDAFVYGGRLRLRLDKLERNLIELPHVGFACGGDVDLLRRDPWREAGLRDASGARTAPPRDTRDILRVSGFALAAFGVGLGERHRVVAQVHAGWAPRGHVDRFSAFRFGTGPLQTESADLARASFPVAGFNQITAEEYVIGGLTYRFEALFFFFPHVRVTGAWGRVGEWDPATWRQRFERRGGVAYSAGFTSGFAFNSQLFVEYSYGTGFSRQGHDGHVVFVMWSKAF